VFELFNKKETVERKARESINRALKWYSREGIELSYVPTVMYVNRNHPLGKDVIASVRSLTLPG